MSIKKLFAVALAASLVVAVMPAPVGGQSQIGRISGTAKDEAKKPYAEYAVRARSVRAGVIAATVPLGDDARFAFANLPPDNYLVELLNTRLNTVVCTEGPFALTQATPVKADVNIACGRFPVAWLLLAAAGAAGIAAGIAAGGTASASQ